MSWDRTASCIWCCMELNQWEISGCHCWALKTATDSQENANLRKKNTQTPSQTLSSVLPHHEKCSGTAGEENKVSPCPQNAPHPDLTQLHGTCLKNEIAWSGFGLKRGWFHLFGLVQWVRYPLHEHQELNWTPHGGHDRCHSLQPPVVLMLRLIGVKLLRYACMLSCCPCSHTLLWKLDWDVKKGVASPANTSSLHSSPLIFCCLCNWYTWYWPLAFRSLGFAQAEAETWPQYFPAVAHTYTKFYCCLRRSCLFDCINLFHVVLCCRV